MNAITAEEMARLRVPLSALPGFDPEGLRVWNERDGLDGTLVRGESGGILVWCPTEGDGHIHSFGSEWALDLADSSTADRVARWVAGRVGLEAGCCAPDWGCSMGAANPATYDMEEERCWVIGLAPDDKQWDELDIPALADLDPTDDRRLPDGSRFVDRLALALVSVHVGGAS